jgi:hypothetical protein
MAIYLEQDILTSYGMLVLTLSAFRFTYRYFVFVLGHMFSSYIVSMVVEQLLSALLLCFSRRGIV